jgi:hypothetical protein
MKHSFKHDVQQAVEPPEQAAAAVAAEPTEPYWFVPSSEATLAPFAPSPKETSELVADATAHDYFNYFNEVEPAA